MKDYNYSYQSPQSSSAISEWAFETYQMCWTDVLPDGCRDVIVKEAKGQDPYVFVSDLSRSTYAVPGVPGVRIRGLRLRPGVQIQQAELYAWLQGRSPDELFVADQLCEFCVGPENLSSALDCLASGEPTVLCVAKELGVSLRTLERLVKQGTGEPPYFWFSLARLRKVARSLYDSENLGVTALDAGFADQSHMNREIKRWLGKTPAQIVNDDYIRGILSEPGYG